MASQHAMTILEGLVTVMVIIGVICILFIACDLLAVRELAVLTTLTSDVRTDTTSINFDQDSTELGLPNPLPLPGSTNRDLQSK